MMKTAVVVLSICLHIAIARQNTTRHAHHRLSLFVPRTPAFLQKGSPCDCSLHGACSCDAALEFMTCIKSGCESGKCHCKKGGSNHFRKACETIASGCNSIDLECSDDEAICDGESVRWEQKEQEEEQQGEEGEDEEEKPEGLKDERKSHDGTKDEEDSHGNKDGEDSQGNDEEKSEGKDDSQGKDKDEEESEGKEDSQGEDKDGLPADWEKVWSKQEERYYYHNADEGVSSWTPPPSAQKPKPKPKTAPLDKQAVKAVKAELLYEHRVFATAVVSNIVVVSATIALLTSSNNFLAKHSWSTLDMLIVSFLALAWFHVTLEALDYHGYKGMGRILAHAAIVIALLAFSTIVTWIMQRTSGANAETSIGTFNSIFDHVIVWCTVGLLATVLHYAKPSPIFVLLAIGAVVVFFAALAWVWYYVIGANLGKRGWSAGTITKLTGVSLAAGIAFWTHMLLVGSLHTVEDPSPSKTTFVQTILMNVISSAWILVTLTCLPIIKKMSDRCKDEKGDVKVGMYWRQRIYDVLTTVVSWMPHYSFLLSVSHLVLDQCGYENRSIEARLYLAVLNSFIGMALIVLCAKVKRIREETLTATTLVGLGGFMAGTAWGGLMNNSISILSKGYSRNGSYDLQLLIVALLTAVVFPVYFYSFKPTMARVLANK